MLSNFLLPVTAVLGTTMWTAISYALQEVRARRRREIAVRGVSCQGRIVAIQRPGLLDSCTRLYFEFAPAEGQRPLVCCHIERRGVQELPCEVLSMGRFVNIRYLPERPQEAVIGRLVTDECPVARNVDS